MLASVMCGILRLWRSDVPDAPLAWPRFCCSPNPRFRPPSKQRALLYSTDSCNMVVRGREELKDLSGLLQEYTRSKLFGRALLLRAEEIA